MAKKIAFLAQTLKSEGINKVYICVNSIANLSRSAKEVEEYFNAYLQVADFSELKIRFILKGDLDKLPSQFKPLFDQFTQSTEKNEDFTIIYMINWSLLDEIARISSKIARAGQDITPKALLQAADISEPIDLIIRTGQRHRLSSFIPLSGQFAEIYFIDKLFPDITESDIKKAVDSFSNSKRTYGL